MSDQFASYDKFRITMNHPEIGKGQILAAHPSTVKVSGMVVFDLTADIVLGDDVEIAQGVQIFTHKHHWKHSRGLRKDIQKITSHKLTIGNDVFIGVNAIILGIESIGDGAVIGAGSVVTHNVPAFWIVAGNPARKIGMREDLSGVEL